MGLAWGIFFSLLNVQVKFSKFVLCILKNNYRLFIFREWAINYFFVKKKLNIYPSVFTRFDYNIDREN